MSDPKPDRAEVARAVKLLQKRGSGDLHRRLAVEKRIRELPHHVHRAAEAHLSGNGHRAEGRGVETFGTREGETVVSTPDSLAQTQLRRGEAQTAIGGEVNRYVDAVKQGHRQGYKDFRVWYRDWEKAKDDTSSELARKVCGFLLDKGLDLVFPEEELVFKLLKEATKKAYEYAGDYLGKEEIEEGDIDRFLDAVGSAEEKGITKELDVHDQFFKSNAPEVEEAIDSFVMARMSGWDSTEVLPPETLEILKRAGVGEHGSAAASVIAERVLAAHIDSVYQADSNITFAAPSAGAVDLMAEIAALKKEQSLPAVDNRDRIYELERGLPDQLRTMCDINNDPPIMIHIRLDLDEDTGEEIQASREKDGPFQSSDDLLARRLLDAGQLRRVQDQIVCG